MNNILPVILPVAGAATGWLLQGLGVQRAMRQIAAGQQKMAPVLGDLAAGMIDTTQLLDKLKDPSSLASVRPVIEAHVNEFLEVKLQQKMPAIAMFIGGSTLAKLREGLLEEIDILLPDVIAGYAGKLSEDFDVRRIVTGKVAALPPERIEALLQQAVRGKLNSIRMMGALTGLITGLLAAGLIWATQG